SWQFVLIKVRHQISAKPNTTSSSLLEQKQDKCLLHAYWEWRLRTKIERERFVLEAEEFLNMDEERREKINQGFSHNIYNSLFFKAIAAPVTMEITRPNTVDIDSQSRL
ncbi:hypothetical protein SARC_16060, partial [Sphaeroforma arctica JP610]